MRCEACGGERMWRVQMHERGRHGAITPMAVAYEPRAPKPPVPMSVAVSKRITLHDDGFYPSVAYGRLETQVCDGCGHTVWYARNFEPDSWINLERITHEPCADCGRSEYWLIDPMRERGGDGEPSPLRSAAGMQFKAQVCCACGRLSWWTRNELRREEPAGGTCIRCRADAVSPPQPVIDHGGWLPTDLPLALSEKGRIGRLKAAACLQCRRVDWRAEDFAGLSPCATVELLDQRKAAGGPYR